jgi:hypothetical protein
MRQPKDSYRESLLQWVWETQQFRHENLRTADGRNITIEDPGLHNRGAGPDFVQARLKIGGLLWYGDVEIHNNEKEWFMHNHHTDSNYNRVVLHVYLNRGSKPAQTHDRFIPFSLNLASHLEKPLFRLLLEKQKDDALACSGNITVISTDVFEKRIAALEGGAELGGPGRDVSLLLRWGFDGGGAERVGSGDQALRVGVAVRG